MWSYYGSKNRISGIYPKPLFNVIIEPFAGAAYYSLRYFENEVLLIDKSPDIIEIWNYLKLASTKDILSLPILTAGTRISCDNFDCNGQYMLMRYLITQGAHHGSSVVSKWGALRLEANIKRVLKNLHKIKHWNFLCADYKDIPNREATWFIDAPYKIGGNKYPFGSNKINYNDLRNYSENRLGQTIVCENTKSDWLPFIPIKRIRGVQHTTTEAIWTNYHTHFNNIQQHLDFNL